MDRRDELIPSAWRLEDYVGELEIQDGEVGFYQESKDTSVGQLRQTLKKSDKQV